MEQELKTHLQAISAEFLAHSRLSSATIWARAVRDARFLERIESGAGFTVKSYDRAVGWFSSNWPAGAVWPADIPRPPMDQEAA